jgi:hypothetical protein
VDCGVSTEKIDFDAGMLSTRYVAALRSNAAPPRERLRESPFFHRRVRRERKFLRPIALKSDNERPLRLADCERFIGQTASYAAGSDKRVAVLCLLDGSRKVEQPFPAEDGIGVLKTADDAVAIVTVLLQGNLARPSDLTRRAPRRRENSPPRRSA